MGGVERTLRLFTNSRDLDAYITELTNIFNPLQESDLSLMEFERLKQGVNTGACVASKKGGGKNEKFCEYFMTLQKQFMCLLTQQNFFQENGCTIHIC